MSCMRLHTMLFRVLTLWGLGLRGMRFRVIEFHQLIPQTLNPRTPPIQL